MTPALAAVFQAVFEASWQGGLAVLAILLARLLLGTRVPACWRHALWALVLLRLALPVGAFPAYPLNVQHIPALDRRLDWVEDRLDRRAGAAESAPGGLSLPARRAERPSGWALAGGVWLGGAALLGAVFLAGQFRLNRRIARRAAPVPSTVAAGWEEVCDRLGVRRRPALAATGAVGSPALVGFLRPRLLIPAEGAGTLTATDWENVFVHELAHYRRGDLWTNALGLLVAGIHWFNPLAWLALRQARIDRELAADDWALRRLGASAARAYGETLLRLLDGQSRASLPLGSLGILENRLQLRERLRRIVAFGPRAFAGSLAGAAVLAVLAFCLLGRQGRHDDLSRYSSAQADRELMQAAQNGDLPRMHRLLAAGADIDERDSQRRPLLLRALENRNEQAVTSLLACGADPNQGDVNGWRPLMQARDGKTVDALIAHGADPLAKTDDGRGVFQIAPYDTEPSRIEALIRHGVPFDLSTDGGQMLLQAARADNVALIDYLVGKGADPNAPADWGPKGLSRPVLPLAAASMGGSDEAVAALLRHGAHPEDGMRSALANRRMQLVHLFWDHGARNISELAYAVTQHAPVADLQKLLDKGIPADPPQDAVPPLCIAAEQGDLEAVRFLVEEGASLHMGREESLSGAMPLVYAAKEGQREVVAYLLQAGVKPDMGAVSMAANNSTPYPDQRSQADFEATIRLLLDAGALRDESPQDKASVLFDALGTRQGPPDPAVVQMLLDAGADPTLPHTSHYYGQKDVTETALAHARKEYSRYGDPTEVQKKVLALLEKATTKAASAGGPPV